MKTSLEIDDDLWVKVKVYSARNHVKLKALVEEALAVHIGESTGWESCAKCKGTCVEGYCACMCHRK